MKKIIFICCIVFGISLSACPVSPSPEKPTKPETAEDKWIKLVGATATDNPDNPQEYFIFDNKGNLIWHYAGTDYKYNFIQMHDSNHAIYEYESRTHYVGFSINQENKLEQYSYMVESIDSIDWTDREVTYGILKKNRSNE